MADICNLCPRQCNIDRSATLGYCKSSDKVRIARVGLHEWEEPCISYGKGSGTIFFSGCNLRCVYCQNNEISSHLHGTEISVDTLADEMLKLQDMGAVNINLVTPTHYADKIVSALDKAKDKLHIPTVYNCGGYESIDALKMLDGYIDIYLPDLKYYSSEISGKYSGCSDYFDVAVKAISEMARQTGKPVFDDYGHMKSGTMVRHLVLPSLYKDSIEAFDNLAKTVKPQEIAVSIMCQYFPTHLADKYSEINRKTTTLEYMKVVDFVRTLGFEYGFMQDKSSAKKDYVPVFDYRKGE
ncbi:MAG: radical SAM protein [Ruminococcaceae bacterium]|nr:radical SAM protein [Oscillospiraceae bacterium]